MAEQKNLCYNCFQEREALEGPCPYCGFDLAENEKKFPVALRAGTVLNDRYIVGRVLGQGGFGITYLALDTQLNAKVAIKEFMPGEIATRVGGTTVSVMMETRSEEFTYGAERFQEEARTLAKFIGNPNIAGVSSYFDENDTSYFVMDYIEGISFKTYIANHGGKISVEETLNVMIPVLWALTAVHQEGFIHRDVTPDNIYITKDGIVKLLDFGSARYSIGDKSKSLDVILKVGYAPKEQYIRRSRQGPFTDVYSCAACFYAAITGFLPPESLERLDHDELVPISQCGIDIPEYLDKAILKGLAVQPEDRFQSAAEFLDAIESQQVVEVPVSGGAAPAPEKRKAKPALIAAIAAAVVVVFALGSLFGGGGGETADGGSSGNPITEALAPIVTIGGEEYSTALTELDLSSKGLTDADLAPLAEMKNLESLNLSGNDAITNLSSLAGLSSLTFLNIMNTGATDLSPLSDLTAMESLHLSNAEITDLSPLTGMSHLKELYLTDGDLPDSKISDLSPLAGLTELETLRIPSVSEISDLSPLSGLTALKTLAVNGISYSGVGKITSLEPLKNLKNLEVINLNVDSEIGVDLTPLAGLAHLRELTFGGAIHMENLGVFSEMTELQELELHATNTNYCSASDLSAFSHMTKLQRLSIEVDGLASLSGIENLHELLEIELYSQDSSCATLQPLAGLENLQSVTISLVGTRSLDISALGELPNLQWVHIGPERAISDKSPIDHVYNVNFFN